MEPDSSAAISPQSASRRQAAAGQSRSHCHTPTFSSPSLMDAVASSGSGAKRVLILGGDGFVGWPTALHLSELGHTVGVVDNLSRRRIDEELETCSATPIASPEERVAAWERVSGKQISYHSLDVAKDYGGLVALFREFRPTTVCHFAEQVSTRPHIM